MKFDCRRMGGNELRSLSTAVIASRVSVLTKRRVEEGNLLKVNHVCSFVQQVLAEYQNGADLHSTVCFMGAYTMTATNDDHDDHSNENVKN